MPDTPSSPQRDERTSRSSRWSRWREMTSLKWGVVWGCSAVVSAIAFAMYLKRESKDQNFSLVSFTHLCRLIDARQLSQLSYGRDGVVLFTDSNGNHMSTTIVPGAYEWLFKALVPWCEISGSPQGPSRSSSPPSVSSTSVMDLVTSAAAMSAGLMYLTHLLQQRSQPNPQSPRRLDRRSCGTGTPRDGSGTRSRRGPLLSFEKIVGHRKTKDEMRQLIEFLLHPEKFASLGVRIPRGILLQGPSGTGKTLLAKTMAAEAGVPFYYASASQFVELYVGQGAQRIRELFKEARENAPSVIFIDELDALGAARSGMGFNNQEYLQSINQLLCEMDGVDSTDTTTTPAECDWDDEVDEVDGECKSLVVVIGATNRVEALDKALVRPGRFDRVVKFNLPTYDERKEMCELHFNNKKKAPDVDMEALAAITENFSGADIESLINEAGLLAARSNNTFITFAQIEAVWTTLIQSRK
eukprot:GHVN01064698.1.p1 GENE.GHVN01064698.1~~GHVN01064698.1.p1  ORF type:complete len:470 (+),score=86.02 GHVN01064698.1:115-1524(+)